MRRVKFKCAIQRTASYESLVRRNKIESTFSTTNLSNLLGKETPKTKLAILRNLVYTNIKSASRYTCNKVYNKQTMRKISKKYKEHF